MTLITLMECLCNMKKIIKLISIILLLSCCSSKTAYIELGGNCIMRVDKKTIIYECFDGNTTIVHQKSLNYTQFNYKQFKKRYK